jgi:putative ABC transport system permease protein
MRPPLEFIGQTLSRSVRHFPLAALALALCTISSMALPLKYSIRNIFIRWRSTISTVLSITLVVAVWMVMQALAAGLEKSAGNTGDPRNLLIVRKGADSESASQITLENLDVLRYAEEIARDEDGKPILSADALVVIYIQRAAEGEGGANVIFRGVSPKGAGLRPQIKLVEGRWFTPGLREVTISRRMAGRFADMHVGGTIKIGARELKVVGHFDGGGSAYDSEAWLDADEARALFSRENYASVLVRPVDAEAGARLKTKLESDKRLVVRVVPEVDYYKEQTKVAGPIRWAGGMLAGVMSIGAVLAAMNTMYASVGARTREIGTLRVLGFRRRIVVGAILLEGAGIAFIGGALGTVCALLFSGYRAGVFNFQTFSESVFELYVPPELIPKGLLFAVIVGAIGSLLPALRAARMPVIAALKAA